MRVPHPPTVTQWVWGVHVFSFTCVQARVTICAHVECCPLSHLILPLETEPFTEPGKPLGSAGLHIPTVAVGLQDHLPSSWNPNQVVMIVQ